MPKKEEPIPRLDICTLSGTGEDDLIISRLEDYLEQHQNLVFPHRHSFYHVVFFTAGGGSHTIDFQQFQVVPNQIYFMTPEQVHAWDFDGKMQGFVTNFSGTFFQSFLLNPEYLDKFTFLTGPVDQRVINLSAETGEKITRLYEEIVAQSNVPKVLGIDYIRLMLLQVFILIQQCSDVTEKTMARPLANGLIRNFQKLVETHYAQLKLPGAYAELLNVTPNHLNAKVKEHLGKQAGEVIRDRVILEAKRLLVNRDLTVSEIAYHLNFEDNSYFTKFFKKYTGSTPEAFREKSIIQNNS